MNTGGSYKGFRDPKQGKITTGQQAHSKTPLLLTRWKFPGHRSHASQPHPKCPVPVVWESVTPRIPGLTDLCSQIPPGRWARLTA